MDIGIEIKGLKMDLMEELMSINDRQALTKIKSYYKEGEKTRKTECHHAASIWRDEKWGCRSVLSKSI